MIIINSVQLILMLIFIAIGSTRLYELWFERKSSIPGVFQFKKLSRKSKQFQWTFGIALIVFLLYIVESFQANVPWFQLIIWASITIIEAKSLIDAEKDLMHFKNLAHKIMGKQHWHFNSKYNLVLDFSALPDSIWDKIHNN